ncbi:MAG TPA: presqualene diphosphate synthase HpnD [Rhodocyclaceae bacterium]
MNPDEYCSEKARAAGSSFTYSFRLLPPARRRAITALYAFCREVDDVVDECLDPQVAATKLAWWRHEVDQLFAGKAQHPVTRALAPAIEEFSLPQEHFAEILDGMAMDLGSVRYPDFKSLSLYCYRVASVVGLLSAEIFGVSDRQTLRYAHDLGIALQLTNIIRDVGDDARRGRIYLPLDEMARHAVTPADILNRRYSEGFAALMGVQADRALDYRQRALAALPAADRKAQRPGLVMAEMYRCLLEEIRLSGYQVLHQRISLPPARKAWIAMRTWVAA